jgi:hypothetical protein
MTETPSRPVPQDHLPSQAARAANSGVPIELTDGRRVILRYTMRGLARIEETVGPLGMIQDALSGTTKPMIRPLVNMIAAGINEPGMDTERLMDLLDITRIDEYADAIGTALEVALPAPKDPQSPQDQPTAGYPGATSSLQRLNGESAFMSSGTT